MWYHKFKTYVKINFESLNFTIWSQFHHKNHTNCTNCWAQDNHMWWHNHNTAILAEFKRIKHAEYENSKKKITDHENDIDSDKKRNKNNK